MLNHAARCFLFSVVISFSFSLTFLFWFKCFFYTHYRFHRRQYVWDLIENHDVLSCVCSGIQSHHIEYESVFHIFHTCNDSSSHNQMSHSLLCTQSRHCLYLLPHISQPNHLLPSFPAAGILLSFRLQFHGL